MSVSSDSLYGMLRRQKYHHHEIGGACGLVPRLVGSQC